MQQFIKRLLSIITMLCLSTASAFASGPFSAEAVLNGTDKSIIYLAQLFGQVGTTLSSASSQQFVSTLFKMYNEGVLVLAGVWILYTCYDMLLKITEKNGEQRLGGVGMKFIKVCLGVILIIPSSTTGYCAIQDLTMFAVKQGVALADSTWNAALDYLKDGNVLTPSIESQAIAAADSTTLASLALKSGYFGTGASSSTAGIPGLINQLICAIDTSTWSSTSTQSLYTESSSGTDYVFTFSGTNCGSVSTSNMSVSATSDDAAVLKEETLSTLLSDLKPAAITFVCNINSSYFVTPAKISTSYFCSNNAVSSSTGTDASSTFNDQLSSAYTNYASNLISILNAATTIDSTTAVEYDTLIDNMKATGWINAGSYYWAIAGWLQNNGDFGSMAGSSLNSPTLSDLKGLTIAPTYSGSDYLSSVGSYSFSNAVNCTSASNCTTLTSTIDSASSLLASASETATLTSLSSYPAFSPDWDSNGNVILDSIYDDIQDLYNDFLSDIFDLSSTTPSGDPLVLLTVIGFNMINLACTLISAVLIIIIAMAVVALLGFSIFGFITNIFAFVFPILNIVLDILKAIAMFLLLVGGTLAIFLPLYPWITWIFAVMGWFVSVIEAMAAAPLVSAHLTRPSGQELAGDARKALILLVGVFLRPVMMVIGFCVAIVLSRVLLTAITHTLAATSLTLLVTNTTANPTGIATAINSISSSTLNQSYAASLGTMSTNFLDAFNSIRGSTSGFAMLVFQVLFIPTIFGIIGYIAYHIISFSFSLTLFLVGYVMPWIGGEAGNMLPQLDQAVKGSKKAAQAGLREGLKVVSAGMGAVAALGSMAVSAGSEEQEGKNENEEGGGGSGGSGGG